MMTITMTIAASNNTVISQLYHDTHPVTGLAILYEFEEIRICFTGYMT